MKFTLRILLNTSPEQMAKLQALQAAFAEVCNALAPIVQATRCWNRVALHHLAYRSLRERFPNLGSQMVCNAIYSVSRACRIVLQHPASPWEITKLGERPLPLLRFLANSPVYFDRHTLSLKDGRLSMYTLDGRMRFQIELKAEDEARFHREKLREIVLQNVPQGYQLSFHFSPTPDGETASAIADAGQLPEYLVVKTADAETAALPPASAAAANLLAVAH